MPSTNVFMKDSTTKLVDYNFLKITCSGSQELIDQMINIFLATTPEVITKIKSNFDDKNWDALNLNAHKAKSAFLIIGAILTASKLEKIELGARVPDKTHLKDLVSEVVHESDSIFNELKNRLLKS